MPTLKFVHLQKFLLMKNRRYIILNLKEVDKFSFPRGKMVKSGENGENGEKLD